MEAPTKGTGISPRAPLTDAGPRSRRRRGGRVTIALLAACAGLAWVATSATPPAQPSPLPRGAAEASVDFASAVASAGLVGTEVSAAGITPASLSPVANDLAAGAVASAQAVVPGAGTARAPDPAADTPSVSAVAPEPAASTDLPGVPTAAVPTATVPAAAAVPAAGKDSDGDGLTDAFETKYGVTSPHKKDTNGNGLIDSAEDSDGDGLSNLGEQRFGTSPTNPDTNGNGIPDGQEDSNHNDISNAMEQDARPLPRNLTPSLAKAYADKPVSYAQGCHSEPNDATIHPCVYGDTHGKTTVVLFGDSHAEEWLPAASRTGKAHGWRIVVLTKSACPSAQVLTANPTYPSDRAACKTWRKRAEAWLTAHRPDLVVITNARAYTLVDANGHPIAKSHVDAAWKNGLIKTLTAMPSASAVVVLADTPELKANVPTCLMAHRTRISACETGRSKAINAAHDRAEKAAANATGATFVSLNGMVCSYDPCPVVAGNVVMWRDQQHLTATFSAMLAPSFGAMAAGAMAAAAHTVPALAAGVAIAPAATAPNAATAAPSAVPSAQPPTAAAPAPASVPAAAKDSDGDGLTDAFETKYGVTSPHKKDTNGNGLIDSAEDSDGDGLSNLGEQRFGTSPTNPDTNGNGIPDGQEDSNHNGISNAMEQDRRPLPANLTPSLAQAPKDRSLAYDRGCHSRTYDAKIHPCSYGDIRGKKTVLLFGDSHALQWMPAASRAGKADGWRLVVLTKSACPSAEVRTADPKYPKDVPACKTWRKSAINWIGSHVPDLIVIANAGGYPLLDAHGHPVPPSDSNRVWQDGLAKTIAAMPSGSKVAVLADTPHLQADVPICLAAHGTRMSACETTRGKANDPDHDAAEMAAAAAGGATFVSLDALVCSYDPCPVVVGNVLIWRNHDHMTATFSRVLAPSFGKMVSRVLSHTAPAVAVAAARPPIESAAAPASVPAAAKDSDGDGLTDAFETKYGVTNPHKKDTNGNGLIDSAEDSDGDGLSNLGEQRVGTSPTNPDTNGNGIPDGQEDSNHNGISNAMEQDRRPLPANLTPSLAQASKDFPAGYADGCHTGPYSAAIHPCVFGDKTGKITIVLFGDSHAQQWLPAAARAGKADAWRIVVLTKSACPAIDVRFAEVKYLADDSACRRWRARAEAWLASHPPDLIVMASSRGYDLVDSNGKPVPPEDVLSTWQNGLATTLAAMPASATVAVVADTPHQRVDVPACLKGHRTRMSACETSRARALDPPLDVAEKSTAEAAGASFVSLDGVVCPYDPCAVVDGNILMWRDKSHLTATFSRRLWPSFRVMVSRLLSPAAVTESAASTPVASAESVAAAPVIAAPADTPVAAAAQPPTATVPAPGAVPAAGKDSDGDGLTDAFETKYGVTSPHKKDTNGNGLIDSAEDSDGDGLSNLGEQRFGTSPTNPDTNGNGIPDGQEDSNHNGISNAMEQDRRPLPANLTPSLAQAPKDQSASYFDGCHTWHYSAAIHPCVYGDPHSKTTIVLFGDSHAEQWLPAATGAGKAHGWRIVVMTKSGCPSVQVLYVNPTFPGDPPFCQTWRTHAEAWLRSHPPDMIVITNARFYSLVDGDGQPIPADQIEQTWQYGLATTLAAMPARSRLVVLADTPELLADVPHCLLAHPIWMSSCETPRSEAISAEHNAAEKAAARAAGAAFTNLNRVICSYDPCPVVEGNVLIWRDEGHVTATFSKQLAPSFAAMASRAMTAAAVTADSAAAGPMAGAVRVSRAVPVARLRLALL